MGRKDNLSSEQIICDNFQQQIEAQVISHDILSNIINKAKDIIYTHHINHYAKKKV